MKLSGDDSSGVEAWFMFNTSWARDGEARSDYFFGAAGLHYKFNENLAAGILFEYDSATTKEDAAEINGTGYLIGPYAAVKLPDQSLYIDGRVLWGASDNEVTPFGTYTDKVQTERMLANLKLSGDIKMENFILTPNLVGSYATDEQEQYTDSLGNIIPSQTVEVGEFSLGVDFAMPIDILTGNFTFKAGLDGIYSSTSISTGSEATSSSLEEWRARSNVGFSYQINENIDMDMDVFYDGLGSDDKYSYGLNSAVGIKF